MNKYLYKLKKEIILDVLFSFLYSLSIGAIPIIMKQLLDYNLNLNWIIVFKLVSGYILLAFLGMCCSYFSQYYSWKWSSSLEENLRIELMDKLLNFNQQDYKSKQRDDYVSVFSNDINVIVNQHFCKIVDIIKSSLMIIIYGAYMVVFLNWQIAVVIIIASILTLFLPKLTGTTLSIKKLNYINSLESLTHRIIDVLSGFSLTNSRSKYNIMNYYKESVLNVKKNEIEYGLFKSFTIVFNGFVILLMI